MICRLLLTVMLATTMAVAQRGRGSGDTGLTEMAAGGSSRLDILTQALQLNKEQKKFVKTTLDDAQKEATPVREQLIKSHEVLGEAVRASQSPEEINRLVSSHAALEVQMARIELDAFAKIFLQLDATQQGNARSLFQMMKGIFNEKNWNTVQ